MAILNGLYIHVTEESAEREVDATSHPVEQGVPTTDTVKAKALSISLSGKIVDYGNMKAAQVLSQIKAWQEAGSLVLYKGRNTASSMQIKSFQTSHPNTNHGGADFSMTLTQVRIAKSAYTPKKQATRKRRSSQEKCRNQGWVNRAFQRRKRVCCLRCKESSCYTRTIYLQGDENRHSILVGSQVPSDFNRWRHGVWLGGQKQH